MTKTLSLDAKTVSHIAILASFVVVSLGIGANFAQAAVTAQMSFGSTGANVINLQTYLATHPEWYPSGLITGYYGSLTQAAVQRFQAAQGIVSSGTPASTGYGRVGPMTLARLNQLMATGGGTQTSSDTVPAFSSFTVQPSRTTASVSWTTNEPTQGQVYVDTATIRADEATGPKQLPYISGTLVADTSIQTNHSVTLSNLQPNTTYYYLVRIIDTDNNSSITWPPFTFRTAQ